MLQAIYPLLLIYTGHFSGWTSGKLTRVGLVERSLNRHRALFEKVGVDKRFQTEDLHIVGVFHEMTESNCMLKCLEVDGCLSINSLLISPWKCVLLSVDRNTASDDAVFVEESGWVYYDTGFDIASPVWRKKSLHKLECTQSSGCGYCGCYKEPGSGKEHCGECWTAVGQLRYDGTMCVRADSGQCLSGDGKALQITTDCSGLETEFQYNPNEKELRTVCSDQAVCVDSLQVTQYLRVKNGVCSINNIYNRFEIGIFGELMLGGYCLAPYGNNLKRLEYCTDRKVHFQFRQKVEGRVQVEVFDSCNSGRDACYNMMSSTQPDIIRNIYNFDLPAYYQASHLSYAGFRMKSYFVAPMNGEHVFSAVCKDEAILYFGESESTKSSIIVSTYPGIHIYASQFADSSRMSAPQTLVSGKKYYMEALIFVEATYLYCTVGVRLPNGVQVDRITQKYLIAYP